jgi:protein ImuA
MEIMAAKRAELRALLDRQIRIRTCDSFRTHLPALDELTPSDGLRCGAIHELLYDSTSPLPKSAALVFARAAQRATKGVIIWSDPRRELNPTAIAGAGIDLRRLILLRPKNSAEEISALAECLRCRGVSATIGSLNRLSDIEARRLQLAAESGGGVGIFLRPMRQGAVASHYAAATRWLVRPVVDHAEGEAQCWAIELLHGHGGRLKQTVLLEVDRETGDVRASAPLADRPAPASPQRVTA